MWIIKGGPIVHEPKVVIEEVTDPVEIARHREQHEQFVQNSDWLEGHWSQLLPQARGKFIAVAAQEAFIADTPEDARRLAETAHPKGMEIVGKWLRCDDGITRPMIRADVFGAGGKLESDDFLVDIGADRTVFSASLLKGLGLHLSCLRMSRMLKALGVRARLFWSTR